MLLLNESVISQFSCVAVVWNPWEKAKTMSDFSEEEPPYMICVEAGHVATPRELAAGQSYQTSQLLTCKM